MQDSVEYQIFIGCTDSQTYDEVIAENELKEIVSLFFERNKINFSMLTARGGYRHKSGLFITENSLCIDIIGAFGIDIIKLAKGLSMYMNQECSLITRNTLKTTFVFSEDNMENNGLFEKGIKYEIFIGLKDKDSYIEVFDVDDFKSIITQVCTHKQLNFSLMTQLGGYTHNKGYTTETSLRVVIIGADENEITVLAEWLKKKINTDAVLITKTEIEYCFM